MKTIEMLINEIKASEALQKLLAEAVKNNALADFLKEQSCDATAEAFLAAVKTPDDGLNDDDLCAVAGGKQYEEVILSIMTLGVGCVVEAIESAVTTGVGNGPDGEILCNTPGC